MFSALGLREGLLYSQLDRREQYRDPLVEGAQLIGLPLARVPDFAPALAAWTAGLFPAETPAETRLRVAVCALSDIAWRDAPELRAEESFRRLLACRSSASITPTGSLSPPRSMPAMRGRPDAPWLSPRSASFRPLAQRRAQILGRAILLAYRFSGACPRGAGERAAAPRTDCVRLEVASAARAPDSEVVADRLRWLAGAIGVKRTEIVVTDEPPRP